MLVNKLIKLMLVKKLMRLMKQTNGLFKNELKEIKGKVKI